MRYGSFSFAGKPLFTDDIAEAVEQFGLGYFRGTSGDFTSHLTLAIGTNNDNPGAVDYRSHGQAWAQLVGQVETWFIDNNYYRQVTAVGANDIEVGWGSVSTTKEWIEGYKGQGQIFYDYGDAGGCPGDGDPTQDLDCSTGKDGVVWKQSDVWYKAWGSGVSFPLPEIYTTDVDNFLLNGNQWRQIARYSFESQHHNKMTFQGLMTQRQSNNGSEPATNNSPEQGWMQLWNALNADNDPRTAQTPRWSTDIKWQ